jgi:hypothetical protein
VKIGGFILLPMIPGREIYQMQRKMLGERAQRHGYRGSDSHKGSMSDMSLALHQSDIPYSKGEILFKGISKASKKGEKPQGENYPLTLMLKGER